MSFLSRQLRALSFGPFAAIPRKPVRIGKIHRDPAANAVRAMVDGAPLWFQAEGADVRPSTEAFLAACLLPAALAGRAVETTGGADPAALDGARKVLALTAAWWRHPAPKPGPSGRPVAPAGRQTALCFSGGVDSMHTLLTQKPDVLVFANPYDIPTHHRPAAAHGEAMTRAVADATGTRAVMLRSNLRDHPLFAGSDWGKIHGGALVAIGHLLGESIGRLLVSASYARDNLHPWGTHPHLDPLWSTPGLEVAHVGEALSRAEKLVAIAHHDVVRRHLRVCWENPAPGNCGTCEKCLRTRLIYWRHLPGVACDTLPPPDTLAGDLAAQQRLPRPDLAPVYRRYFLDGAPPDDPVCGALAALIRRSPSE